MGGSPVSFHISNGSPGVAGRAAALAASVGLRPVPLSLSRAERGHRGAGPAVAMQRVILDEAGNSSRFARDFPAVALKVTSWVPPLSRGSWDSWSPTLQGPAQGTRCPSFWDHLQACLFSTREINLPSL